MMTITNKSLSHQLLLAINKHFFEHLTAASVRIPESNSYLKVGQYFFSARHCDVDLCFFEIFEHFSVKISIYTIDSVAAVLY